MNVIDYICYIGLILCLIGLYKNIIKLIKIHRKIEYLNSDQSNIKEMRRLKLKKLNTWKFLRH